VVSTLAAVVVSPSGAAESALTPRNSILAPLVVSESISIEGVGCGASASATVTLPTGASDVRVRRPRVGARSDDARLTRVVVQRNAVTFTAVAEGESACDPDAADTPPASRSWSADFGVEVAFRQRVGVVLWDAEGARAKNFVVRPREVRVRLVGAARRVRWTQFRRP
jgi:hypothetical protein